VRVRQKKGQINGLKIKSNLRNAS